MTKRATAIAINVNVEAMIAETAYYKAEQRGFSAGDEVADWLAAEREVHAILSASEPPPTRRRAATGSRATKKAPTKKAATTPSTTRASTTKGPRKTRSPKAESVPNTD